MTKDKVLQVIKQLMIASNQTEKQNALELKKANVVYQQLLYRFKKRPVKQEVLSHLEGYRYGRTIKEIAQACELTKDQVYYSLEQLQKQQLVEKCGSRSVTPGKREQSLYRCIVEKKRTSAHD